MHVIFVYQREKGGMKRLRDFEYCSSLQLLEKSIGTNKSLLAYMLGFAYPSCSAIARTCKLFSVPQEMPALQRFSVHGD
jgi:hypothetical protein